MLLAIEMDLVFCIDKKEDDCPLLLVLCLDSSKRAVFCKGNRLDPATIFDHGIELTPEDKVLRSATGQEVVRAFVYEGVEAPESVLEQYGTIIDQDQWSNELRYNLPYGDGSNLTMGFYYLDSTVRYSEGRDLLGLALVGTPLEGSPAATQPTSSSWSRGERSGHQRLSP